MRTTERWLLALLLVLIDLVAVFVPLTAIAAGWILVTRPPWFRSWIDSLYQDR